MRSLCLLLTLFVLVLTVKPCCTDSDRGCENLTVTRQAPTPTPEKNCEGCSPFFACGACAGFVITGGVNYALVTLPDAPIKHINNYQHPYIEAVTLAIWQPPQIA